MWYALVFRPAPGQCMYHADIRFANVYLKVQRLHDWPKDIGVSTCVRDVLTDCSGESKQFAFIKLTIEKIKKD